MILAWPLKLAAVAIAFSLRFTFVRRGCKRAGNSVILLIDRSTHYGYKFQKWEQLTCKYCKQSELLAMKSKLGIAAPEQEKVIRLGSSAMQLMSRMSFLLRLTLER